MVKKQNSKIVFEQKSENKGIRQKNKIENNNNNIYPSKEMLKFFKYKNIFPLINNQKNFSKIQNLKHEKDNLFKANIYHNMKNSIFSFYNKLIGFSSNNKKRFFLYKNKISYAIAVQNLFFIFFFIPLLIVKSIDSQEIEKLSFNSSEISLISTQPETTLISTKPEIKTIEVLYVYPNPKTTIITNIPGNAISFSTELGNKTRLNSTKSETTHILFELESTTFISTIQKTTVISTIPKTSIISTIPKTSIVIPDILETTIITIKREISNTFFKCL